MVTRPPRKGASPVVATLAGLVVLAVGTALTVVVFAAPGSPGDLAVVWCLVVAATVLGWAVTWLWRRITRKRRQYRNSG